MIKFILTTAVTVALISTADAQTGTTGGSKPTPAQKIDSVLPAQPPQASTTAKPSPVGQPITSTATTPGYKPAPPKMNIKEPPSPR
jgi:hypothetical protein